MPLGQRLCREKRKSWLLRAPLAAAPRALGQDDDELLELWMCLVLLLLVPEI